MLITDLTPYCILFIRHQVWGCAPHRPVVSHFCMFESVYIIKHLQRFMPNTSVFPFLVFKKTITFFLIAAYNVLWTRRCLGNHRPRGLNVCKHLHSWIICAIFDIFFPLQSVILWIPRVWTTQTLGASFAHILICIHVSQRKFTSFTILKYFHNWVARKWILFPSLFQHMLNFVLQGLGHHSIGSLYNIESPFY